MIDRVLPNGRGWTWNARLRGAAVNERLATACLLVVLCLIYVPNVGHGFVKDDAAWITRSSLATARDFAFGAPSGFYRPMVSLSFAVNRWLFGVQNAFWYGMTNFILLLGCVVGVYSLGRAMSMSHGTSITASAVWAFNWSGINMAVLWISGRTGLLLVMFATAGATAFLRQRWLLAAILMFAAMLSKEEAVLLPFVLITWLLIDRVMNRSAIPRSALMFGAASTVLECTYFLMRSKSGAFTVGTAPSYYRLSASVSRFIENAPSYLDRSATFALVITIVFWLIFRPRWSSLSRTSLSHIAFGVCWFIGGLAITVFLPVRSSLYACLPSVGVALVAASVMAPHWRTLTERKQTRAVVLGVAATILLLPLYYARNLPSVRSAELSTRTLTALQEIADEHGAGTTVVIRDDRAHTPSLDTSFGTLLQDTADLVVSPHIVVWMDPPPLDAALAGIRPSERADVTLVLKDGAISRN
jgi:hypothetical protein